MCHLLNAVSVGKHGIVLRAYLLYYIVCNKNKTLRNTPSPRAIYQEHMPHDANRCQNYVNCLRRNWEFY